MAIDEDDEFFLTLSNVGMLMRPDLFEQHTTTSTVIQTLLLFTMVCRTLQLLSILAAA
jgi:hypothetical protein